MAKYTTLVKSIVESKSGLDIYKYENPEFVINTGITQPNYEDVIAAARQRIFDFSYPIFSESYRQVLETKILKHYYFREIAFETYMQWHLKLDEKLNLIMPYYNQLYNSQGLDFDPFNDVDYEITHTEDTSRVGLFKGENSLTHDQDTTSNLDVTIKDTDTRKENNTLTNTHNDATDFQGTDETTKGTKVITKNTGTQRKDIIENQENDGSDTTEFSGDNESSNTQNVDNLHWNIYDDTPQGAVDNIERDGFYTNVRKETAKDKTTNTGKSSETDSSVTMYGKTTNTITQDTRTDNLTQEASNSGKDTFHYVRSEENNGGYTNTDKKDITDTKNGNRKEVGSGTNDFTDTGKTKSDEDIKTTDDWLRKVSGKMNTRTYASILLEYRETFLNIDKMIIDELEDLFFLLW